MFFNDFHFTGEEQRQSLFPGNDPKRLIRSVQ